MRANYVKTHFSDDLKNKILSKNGIEIDKSKKLTRSNIICTRCNYTNGIDAQLCSKCGYILNQEALNKIKEDNKKVESLQTQLEQSNQQIAEIESRYEEKNRELEKQIQQQHKDFLLYKFNNFIDRLLELNQEHRSKIVEEITSKNNGKLDRNIDPLTIEPQKQFKAYLASPEGKRLSQSEVSILEECIKTGEISRVSLMGIDKDDYKSDYPVEYDKGKPIIRL